MYQETVQLHIVTSFSFNRNFEAQGKLNLFIMSS